MAEPKGFLYGWDLNQDIVHRAVAMADAGRLFTSACGRACRGVTSTLPEIERTDPQLRGAVWGDCAKCS